MVQRKFVINAKATPEHNQDDGTAPNCFKKFVTRLGTRKTIEQLQHEAGSNSELKRTLGTVQLLALGIGGIIGKSNEYIIILNEDYLIGTGIFVLSGEAAAKYAGPAVVISFIIAAIVAGLAAFSYAEMSSMVPISGSAYSYTYASMFEHLFNFSFYIFFFFSYGW